MRHLLVSALLLALASCQHSARQPTPEDGSWDGFVENYLERHFAANPSEAVAAGRHEWDGKLPDWSKEGLAREIARLKAEKARALAFPGAKLDARQKFEREYLVSVTDGRLFWIEGAELPYRDPSYYAGVIDPNVYVTRLYAPVEVRARAFAMYAASLPGALEQVRANIRLPLARPLLDQGKLVYSGLASYVGKDALEAFKDVKDEPLQAELRKSASAASASLKKFADWLDSERARSTTKFQLGRDRFQRMLMDTERVGIPVNIVEKAGRADLERNLSMLKEICKTYAPGLSLKQCVSKEESNKPKDPPVLAARKQLSELKSWLEGADLVSIPGTEEATVEESPPYMRWNFAYIDIPGPYEKGLKSIYYISPPDPKWPKKEQEAYIPGEGNLLNTSVHEVWPGHFLQFLHANRSKSKFSRVFVSYAFAEGWAHYVEELAIEAGIRGGHPEARIGQILGALERDVRLLSAIGLHAGGPSGMTQAQSEKLFREKGLMDPGSAKQQAARGTFDPAYLNYTMGKLMIRKLRDDWCASRGGRSCWRRFHDEFLSYGGPPIPLARAAMMGASDAGPLF
jgi:hypothetical protein